MLASKVESFPYSLPIRTMKKYCFFHLSNNKNICYTELQLLL